MENRILVYRDCPRRCNAMNAKPGGQEHILGVTSESKKGMVEIRVSSGKMYEEDCYERQSK